MQKKFVLQSYVYSTNVDIAVFFIPFDREICNEILTKADVFFTCVFIPQLLAEQYVKSKYQAKVTPVEILEDDDNISDVDIAETVEANNTIHFYGINFDQLQQPPHIPPTSLYTCCTGGTVNGPTSQFSNVDCLIGVFHKSCFLPKRKNFESLHSCWNLIPSTLKSWQNQFCLQYSSFKYPLSARYSSSRSISSKSPDSWTVYISAAHPVKGFEINETEPWG